MPRKKKEEVVEEKVTAEETKATLTDEEFDTVEFIRELANAIGQTRTTYKLKVCIHEKDMEFCKIIELPFQPKNGDLIAVHPDGKEEGWRLTIVVNNLIYDYELGAYVMRSDIIKSMTEQRKKEIENPISGPMEIL